MLKKALAVGLLALAATPALADPDKDESGNGRYYSDGDRDDRRWNDRDDRRWDDRDNDSWDRRDRDDGRRYIRADGHYPPPGMCRVWFYDRPAGHQPPPTNCREARRVANRYGGRVIFGGNR